MWPKPLELHSALKRVREQHPYSSTGTIARSQKADSDAGDLWKRLLDLPEPEQRAVVARLSRLEVGLLAYGSSAHLGEPAGVRLLRFAALEHEQFSTYKVVVELFVAGNGDPGFAGSASKHANRREHPYWQRLTRHGKPLVALCEDYLNSTNDLEGFLQDPEVGFASSVTILKSARRMLLTPTMVGRTLKREGVRKWEHWFTLEYSEEEREQWFIWYLQTDLAHQWAPKDAILRAIHLRHGAPDSSQIFWSKAGPELLKKFKRWLLDSQLTDVLGESDRTLFWRDFLHSVTECWPSKDSTALFIQGIGWYAVQFVEMGRATYIFPDIVPRPPRTLLRNELYSRVLRNRANSIGRYEHRRSNWQHHARSVVRRIIRTYSDQE